MCPTLTSKGQVTVPKSVRDVLGVHAGDRIAFRVREGGVVTVEAETLDLMSLGGSIVPEKRGVTIEEMNAVIRRRAAPR